MLPNAVRAKSPPLIPAAPTGSGSFGQQVRSGLSGILLEPERENLPNHVRRRSHAAKDPG